MPSAAPSPLKAFLITQAEQIHHLEAQASEALYTAKNETAYRSLLVQKAELLAAIADNATAHSFASSSKDTPHTMQTLAAFANNARQALTLGSVFYMSALLYPDNHQPGTPNNLELLILSIL